MVKVAASTKRKGWQCVYNYNDGEGKCDIRGQ